MIVARPLVGTKEPDLLAGLEMHDLRWVSCGRQVAAIKVPEGGWGHQHLEALISPVDFWDAYLGDQWIGSSEI